MSNPLPSLPPRGKEQNLSPLGEIRKGVKKKIKNIKIFVAEILKDNTSGRLVAKELIPYL